MSIGIQHMFALPRSFTRIRRLLKQPRCYGFMIVVWTAVFVVLSILSYSSTFIGMQQVHHLSTEVY